MIPRFSGSFWDSPLGVMAKLVAALAVVLLIGILLAL